MIKVPVLPLIASQLLVALPPSYSFLVCSRAFKSASEKTASASRFPFSSLSTGLSEAVNEQLWTELAISTALGLLTDPVVEAVFNSTHIKHSNLGDVEFRDTLLFGAADSLTIAARVFAALLVVDLIADQLKLDLPFPQAASLSSLAPSIAATIWAALTVSAVKKTIFLQAIEGTRLGRVELYDKLIDFFIGIAAVVVVLSELHIDIGSGFQSIIAGSGVGALVFSLASKDLVQQIVGGFVIQAWDAFEVGDDVKLGDGTEGTIRKIGLVETELVGYDNIAVKIPNSQLTSQRVSNLSRLDKSRVYQLLRFQYSDLGKLPQVLKDIKQEIRNSCPKLIVDGSKPFQAILVAYEADHIQAAVNCHFDIPPSTGAYADNREQVLLAIARALESNNVSFALPSIVYESKESLFVDTPNNDKD